MPSKQEYLKRYLEPEKHRKINKRKVKQKGNLTVKDSDVGWDDLNVPEEDDKPTIACVIDDRPEELKKKQDGWKSVGGKNTSRDRSPKRRDKEGKSLSRRVAQDSDESSLRKKRYDSDASPSKKDRNSDLSPERRSRREKSDSSASPRRKKIEHTTKRHKLSAKSDSDASPPRRKKVEEAAKRHKPTTKSDSDNSPPRRLKRVSNSSDESPLRKPKVGRDEEHDDHGKSDRSRKKAREHGRDSRRKRYDLDAEIPPRKRYDSDEEPPKRKTASSDPDCSPKRNTINKRPNVMSDGGRAGINNREDLKTAKNDKFKDSNMAKIIDDAKSQETIYRQRGTGKKRDFQKEKKEKEEEQKRKEEELKNYKVWNKGKIQLEEKEANVESYLKETGKPLARYKDDEDYNKLKKDKMHPDDPMYAYVMKHKRVSTKQKRAKVSRPIYTGGVSNMNRFNIQPGYRWDGVDRGTGYEVKYFKHMQKMKQNTFDAWRANTDDF